MPAVHQFHQGIRRLDAVSEEMLALKGILRGAGYESDIFVGETIPEDLRDEVRPLHELRPDAGQLLLMHHSIGHAYAGLLADLPARRALVYHNITPTRFFAGNAFMQTFLDRGRRQLRFLSGVCVGALADSPHNGRELVENGFVDVDVVPPIFAAHRLRHVHVERVERDPEPMVLFAGRLARNKGQIEVVAAFERFVARHAPNARLVMPGAADEGDPYVLELRRRIAASPARSRIETPGLVSDDELVRLYTRARVYLSMSEHEGFGVPLLEAFAHELPVVAFAAGAVPETMGGAGVVFADRNPDIVAGLLADVVFDEALRKRLIASQLLRLERPDLSEGADRFLRSVSRWLAPRREEARTAPRASLRIRFEGPFETSYGIAVANRGLAEALECHTAHQVSIHCTEGPGDYLPRASDLEGKPLAARLFSRSLGTAAPDVVIRNMYPPRFERGPGTLQVAYFAWEDSALPPGWAEEFNATYDAIFPPSRYVAEVLARSGVTIPIRVVPNVVPPPSQDETGVVAFPAAPGAGTTFLAVGSAFPRKGIDVLIRAFARAFRAGDGAKLVLKTFPNPHNTVARQLAELRAADPDAPEIVHVDEELSPAGLAALYRTADAFVQPSRAEGFGLPPAEAMVRGLPVIATSATALADFCTDETCLVIPHRMVPSESHFGVPGALWAEPDEDALAEILRGFASGALRKEAARRAARAREVVQKTFSPAAVARVADAALAELWSARAPVRVAFVSTWNTRCGIASYTRDLVQAFPPESVRPTFLGNADALPNSPDGADVARPWAQASGVYEPIVNEAREQDAEIVHVQFHPGLFADYDAFARTLHALCDRGRRVVLTVHLTEAVNFHGRRMVPETLVPAFARCAAVLAHSDLDVQRLAALGLRENVRRISIGGRTFPMRDQASLARELGFAGRRVFGTFGFALPHKGVLESIEATAILRKRYPSILFLALASERPEAVSREYVARCRRRVSELELSGNVQLVHRFLTDDEISVLLGATETVVLPYQPTLETASAAVRYPLACGKATITTRERIFDDVRSVVHRIPDGRPESIAAAVDRLLADHAERTRLAERAWLFARERSWERIAETHLSLYRGLRSPDRAPAAHAAGERW